MNRSQTAMPISFLTQALCATLVILAPQVTAAQEKASPVLDQKFLEEYKKAACAKERADASRHIDSTLKKLKIFEINSALDGLLATSPLKEEVTALQNLLTLSEAARGACLKDKEKWFNHQLDQEKCLRDFSVAQADLKARGDKIRRHRSRCTGHPRNRRLERYRPTF